MLDQHPQPEPPLPTPLAKPEWLAGLKAHIAACRAAHPIPALADLSAEEDWQRRMIGGTFIDWYQNHYRTILAERNALRMIDFDPEPILVFTTDLPGLAAAQEIIPAEAADAMLYLRPEEFADWEARHSPESFTFHIHHWSHLRRPGADTGTRALAAAQAARPDVPPAEFRLHEIGELWHERCGQEVAHLWRWDDHTATLERLMDEPLSHGRF